MNFDITTNEWQQVTELTDDTTYVLQTKTVSTGYGITAYGNTDILFVQNATEPTDNKTGFLGNEFKFKKVTGVNIYIKATSVPVNIEIQEVQ